MDQRGISILHGLIARPVKLRHAIATVLRRRPWLAPTATVLSGSTLLIMCLWHLIPYLTLVAAACFFISSYVWGYWTRASRPWEISSLKALQYQRRIEQETAFYSNCQNVHDLPEIFHYWSNKYLVPKFEPFGFSNPNEFYCLYVSKLCRELRPAIAKIVSVGSGNCEFEVDLAQRLLKEGIDNFEIESLDLNAAMLERGQVLASEKGVLDHLRFTQTDINAWNPARTYEVVIANQSLHHFVELELLFSKIKECLTENGYFLSGDMIGRNGHMRWPEALDVVHRFWRELPDRYKYNHQLKRLELEYENWDCSLEGFEGIRAQDVLPLLIKNFHFDLFIAFGNVINVFVDRAFGHNFDPQDDFSRSFIDKIQAADEQLIEEGVVKPTQMIAAMTKHRVKATKTHRHLTPDFCVRSPESVIMKG